MNRRSDESFFWQELESRPLADCHIFSVHQARRISPAGEEALRFYLDAPDWVTVIPLLEKEGKTHCLMVRQYRQGSRSVTWEFPAGMVDTGEDPAVAMARELQEETGHKAREISLLGQVNPNSAFMNNTQHIFLARDVQAVSSQSLDRHEDVEYAYWPLEEVIARMGRENFSNGTMMTALGFYLRWREENDENK